MALDRIATGTTDSAGIAVGTVSSHAASAGPAGYLKCNGAAVSRTAYADLFTSIGTVWGVGDGSTTFNLPDLRGEFLRGFDDGAGVDGGRVFGSFQLDQYQGHYHTTNAGTDYAGSTQYDALSGSTSTNAVAGSSISDGTNGTPRVGTETRPRNIAMSYWIKF